MQLLDYEFNFEFNLLKQNTNIVKLTDKELLLVALLFKNLGNIVSKEEISKYVYESNLPSDSSLRRLISRTRDKLPGLSIQSESKQGYFLREQ
ncbi:hypothetical protein MNB_SM-4-1541 [hydrothermal vent metagenome]|uniref:OmpR/PhoB-type domain-containing protein n=1 Tax=hydrothermal vent metagenome TaxID=652676 RepID=A0A1W1BE46_9ZZZZ